MTLGEFLSNIGYDPATPQPSLVNAELLITDPMGDPCKYFKIDQAVRSTIFTYEGVLVSHAVVIFHSSDEIKLD